MVGTTIAKLAEELKNTLKSIGGDPNDIDELRSFIVGCEINNKIVKHIQDSLGDDE